MNQRRSQKAAHVMRKVPNRDREGKNQQKPSIFTFGLVVEELKCRRMRKVRHLINISFHACVNNETIYPFRLNKQAK